MEDTSIERYLFDGERSHGRYLKREFMADKGPAGLLEQFFDGRRIGVRVNSKEIHDASAQHFAALARKGNYFWFALPFKLLDQGIFAEPAGATMLDGVRLERIDIRFAPGVGEQSDRIRLFVHESTKEIHHLVFSGYALGGGPYVMNFTYDSLHGLKLATRRSYQKADWDGVPKGQILAEHFLKEIRFWNGYGASEFAP